MAAATPHEQHTAHGSFHAGGGWKTCTSPTTQCQPTGQHHQALLSLLHRDLSFSLSTDRPAHPPARPPTHPPVPTDYPTSPYPRPCCRVISLFSPSFPLFFPLFSSFFFGGVPLFCAGCSRRPRWVGDDRAGEPLPTGQPGRWAGVQHLVRRGAVDVRKPQGDRQSAMPSPPPPYLSLSPTPFPPHFLPISLPMSKRGRRSLVVTRCHNPRSSRRVGRATPTGSSQSGVPP